MVNAEWIENYPSFPEGISLEVKEGSVVALLGRNGRGKTTTIRSIIGFIPPLLVLGARRKEAAKVLAFTLHGLPRRVSREILSSQSRPRRN